MIMFKYIKYKNFLSTGNIFTTIRFDKENTTLIVGKNGSGKSTILDTLSFLLFGKAYRNINKPQLINSITQKDCVVEGEFSVGTINYKIIRGIKPAIFELYSNGTLLNKNADSDDYQDILEKTILKTNHKSFCQIVVLGSATFKPFMGLTKPERRKIIEDLLDLEIFTSMNALNKSQIASVNEQINELNYKKKLVEQKIEIIKEHLNEKEINVQALVASKDISINTNIEAIKDLEIDIAKVEVLKLEKKSKIIDHEPLEKKSKKLNILRHKIEAKLELIKKDILFFEKHDDCPTCQQPIDNKFKCEHIEKKNKEVKEIEDGLNLLYKEYNSLEEQIKSIMKLNSEISNLDMKINQCHNQMLNYSNNIKVLTQEKNNIQKVQKPKETYKVDDLEKELENISIDYNELVNEKTILAAASSLLKDDGIKARIIKQYIPVINKLINKYLSAMEFMCQFELNEEFKESIKSRFRDEFSYESFSEGEKMRINLAILFTWRAVSKLRNSINTNILIMDEVFDSSLDSDGTEEFIKLINSLTNDTNSYIISHKSDQLFDKFDKVITFQKVKNFSRIKV